MRRTGMFYGCQDDYIQVVAKRDDMEKLEALGFVHVLADLPETSVEAPVFPTMEQSEDRSVIMAMSDKDDIEKYVLRVTGVDLDKRGSIETIKEKALKVLADGNSGSSN